MIVTGIEGLAVLAILTIIYIFVFRVGLRDPRLPPGPPCLPVLGNLHQIPTKRTHLQFQQWAKQYGEIFSLKFGPATSIVITSPRLVKELIDKKSNIYSRRPVSYIADMMAHGDHILFMQYSHRWRTIRKLLHQVFMEQQVVNNHIKVVDAEAVQMLRDLIEKPEGYMKHPKRFTNSIVMSLIYGTRTPSVNYRHMVKLYSHLQNMSQVMEAGNAPPLDIFPFLKLVPEKYLGMWRSRAQSVREEMITLFREWAECGIRRRESRGSVNCFLDRVLDDPKASVEIDRHGLYFLCGTLIQGGSDTSSSLILIFIHAVTKWPEVLKKAQEEMDRVVGAERTPTWEDYESLPYIAACVKECHRWRPPSPLGFPHCLAEDDWVDGMYLPKGSDIFINAFGIHHDEKRFPNPDTFDPDHFKGCTALASELANGEYSNRDHYGFGSGRRLCPGIHLAERVVFLGIAKLVWAFNIGPGTDKDGSIIEPDVSNERVYSAGFLVCAEQFPCTITLRDEERRETILRESDRAWVDVFSTYETPEDYGIE